MYVRYVCVVSCLYSVCRVCIVCVCVCINGVYVQIRPAPKAYQTIIAMHTTHTCGAHTNHPELLDVVTLHYHQRFVYQVIQISHLFKGELQSECHVVRFYK